MTDEKRNTKGYLFLGISILSAVLASSLFFYKTDIQLYNLALSAPNSLPQKYVSFLKENERWKEIIGVAELCNNITESYTDDLSEEIRTEIAEITNSSLEAKEQRKTFSYWKKEGFKAITLRKGDDAPQETFSKVTSQFVDMYLGDYITVVDAGHKYVNNEREEIDEFNTILSGIGVALGLATLFSGGTAAPLTTPNHFLVYVLKKTAQKMKSQLRKDFILQLNEIRKDTSLLIRYKNLAYISFSSPEIAIWLLTIPNNIEQGERLWNLLSNCYSKKEMKNVIKQGTMMLSFYNNPEQFNSVNMVTNDVSQTSENSVIENPSKSQSEESVSENNVSEPQSSTFTEKGIFNKTIDYLGKKKDEILNKENSESSEEEIEKKAAEEILVKKKKKMFEESAMISSLEEILSVLEVMSQQDRISAQELFWALCYGQQGLDALKQNKLHDFMSYRDCINSNSFEAKAKNIIILYKNIILSMLSIISLLTLVAFITVKQRLQLPADKSD